MSTLNDAMEMDCPVWITGGEWTDVPRELPIPHAPDITLETDDDGQLFPGFDADVLNQAKHAGWDVLEGYTGQYGYRGAVMHPSEYIGGDLARDILAHSGVYVVTVVNCLGGDDDPEPAGWVVLRLRHVEYPHEDGYLHDCPACELGPDVCTEGPDAMAACLSRECARR